MDDAGALLQRDVLTQEHRRVPVVERVPKRQVLERHPLGGREYTPFEPEAFEAACHEVGREQEVAALGAYERVAQGRMNVERLIRRDRPRRRGPDHGGDRAVGNFVQPEDLR